jgi:hypothetical protein
MRSRRDHQPHHHAGTNVFLYSEVTFAEETAAHRWRSSTKRIRRSPHRSASRRSSSSGPVYLVHIIVKQKGDYEKAAFLIRNEVETALLGSVQGKTLGGLVQWLRRVSAAPSAMRARRTPVYRLTLQLQANIRHLESRPDSVIA